MAPKFSVIIATYNRAALLKRALDSLLAQTERDWEALVIDDGSTDETEEKIQAYLKLNRPIHYFKQENKGVAHSKNAGMRLACGKFITFLDSDDEFKPDHLESRRIILEKNPKAEFLHGGVKVIGNQYVPDRHNPKQKIHLSQCVIGGTFFINREAALSLDGFKDLPIGTDADLFERAVQAKLVIMKTDHPTYLYHRMDDDSITHNFMKTQRSL